MFLYPDRQLSRRNFFIRSTSSCVNGPKTGYPECSLPSRLCNACNVVLLVWNIPTLNLVMPSAYIDRAREEHRRQADSLLKAEGRSILLEKENPEENKQERFKPRKF